jgi:hypothetical protein
MAMLVNGKNEFELETKNEFGKNEFEKTMAKTTKNTLTRQGNVVKYFVILKFEEENIEIKS